MRGHVHIRAWEFGLGERLAGSRLRWTARRLYRAAQILRPWTAFLVGELRGGTRRYRIGNGQVLIRHRSRDVAVVNEIFGADPPYEPPATVAIGHLSRPLRIVDLGGNIGLFGVRCFARWPVQSLLSFEPDPANASLLRRVRDLNGWGDRWEVRERAVGARAGELQLLALGSPESRRAHVGEHGIRVEVEDLFALSQPIDLLKIDIEGGEWELLGDARLASFDARTIVMEWHAPGAPQPDPRAAAMEALQRAGYSIERDEPTPSLGIGLLWAVRA